MEELASILGKTRKLLRRFDYYSWALAVVVVSSQLSIGAFAAEQKPAAAPATSKAVASELAVPGQPATIPLADIASRATEVAKFLGNLTTDAVPSAQIENIAKSLPDLSEKLDAQVLATTTTLEAEPTLDTVQTLHQQWQRQQIATTAFLSTLTQHATKLQDGLDQLAKLQETWTNTLSSAQASNAPQFVIEQIDTTRAAIAAAQAKIQTERLPVLNLQSRIAREVNKCGTVLTQIEQYQQKAVAGIFVPDAEPVWRTGMWAEALEGLPEHVRKVSTAYKADLVRYLTALGYGFAVHMAGFILLALLFVAARRNVDRWNQSGAPLSPALLVFGRPYAAALGTVLVFATSPVFDVPTAVRQLLVVVALVSLTRLVRPVVSSSVAQVIYALGVLFAIDTLRQAFAGIRLIGQAMIVAETLVAIVVLISLRRYRKIIAERAESSRLIFLKATRFLVMSVLIFSLLAASAGYVRLARLLTPGILVGGALALAVFAYLQVAAGVIALVFRIWPLRLLQMVEHHRELLIRRVYVLLFWAAIVGWSVRYLDYLGLFDPTWALVENLLTAKIARGSIVISLGDILEFFLVVWLAYVLSRFIRFVLQEDVYPRINLAPGLSYAASSLLNYIILALGFIAGLAVLGMDFSKVSIIAGAFGVGIGFGLQSIVNNFVSGLILLFERPIHVGDTVDLGDLQGMVRRIGIRASVIHTGAGADIIIPNSQLVTEKVTNWTLSDRLRRVDLPIGINYGADPKTVIEVLEQTARKQPEILQEPAPRALLISYGDSAINFELRVWPSHFSQAAQVKSDLAASVYAAVNAAGMSIPFPQREVRLLRDPEGDPNGGIIRPGPQSSARPNEKDKSA